MSEKFKRIRPVTRMMRALTDAPCAAGPPNPLPRHGLLPMNPQDHQALTATDPDLWSAIADENRRQEDHIELIASENYASRAVMAAQGSQLTNKYAEGYPGRRYYGGCEHVDRVEQLALDRVRRLFGADAHGWAANVQAHSGRRRMRRSSWPS